MFNGHLGWGTAQLFRNPDGHGISLTNRGVWKDGYPIVRSCKAKIKYRAEIITSVEIHLLDLVINSVGSIEGSVKEIIMLDLITVPCPCHPSDFIELLGINGFKDKKLSIVSFLGRAPTDQVSVGKLSGSIG